MFDPAEIARAGAFVSIAHDGALRVERGYGRAIGQASPILDQDAGNAAEPVSAETDLKQSRPFARPCRPSLKSETFLRAVTQTPRPLENGPGSAVEQAGSCESAE